MDQALKEVNNLTVTLLMKEFSSENLGSIFKVDSPDQPNIWVFYNIRGFARPILPS